MKIDCISDLHGKYPILDGGDLLIVAGDLTACDHPFEHLIFQEWINEQKYECKVFIAGNHDGYYLKQKPMEWQNVHYLFDSGLEYDGLWIWGSPWTQIFCDWHYMLPPGKAMKEKWDLIPNDTDILITHGPSYGILDRTAPYKSYDPDDNLGCIELRQAISRIKPKLHVFGHIHGGYGMMRLEHLDEKNSSTLCVNAAHVDQDYRAINQPIRINL